MALTYSVLGKGPTALGAEAPNFSLPAVDGKRYSLASFDAESAPKGLLVIFMCNHCPYVQAIQQRLVDLANQFIPQGIAMIGINSNDAKRYPDDSFEAMKAIASQWSYPFVYAMDESQEVAKAYDAVCTPDIYLYRREKDDKLKLAYHGRMDDSWKDPSKIKKRDLSDAMAAIIANKPVVTDQQASMGCSIKWK